MRGAVTRDVAFFYTACSRPELEAHVCFEPARGVRVVVGGGGGGGGGGGAQAPGRG